MQVFCDLRNVLQGKMELQIQNNHVGIVKIPGMNYQTVSGYRRKKNWKHLSSFMGIKLIKLKSPSFGGHKRRGNQKMRPKAASTRLNYSTLLQTLSNSSISAESKQQIMQRAVSNCPSVTLQLLGIELPSLLDSGSMVTLIREGFFYEIYTP